MPRATFGVTLAESAHTGVSRGNYYFPPEPVHFDPFRESEPRTNRPWRGGASHYAAERGGKRVEDAERGTIPSRWRRRRT